MSAPSHSSYRETDRVERERLSDDLFTETSKAV